MTREDVLREFWCADALAIYMRRDVIDCRLGETYSADEWEQTAKLSDACADACSAIAAECRAVEGPDKPRVESPTGTWTLTTDPDCPRAWEHRRDGGTVDSLVFADEVVHMYHVQQGQGLDAATSERATPRDSGDADAGLDTQRTTAHPAPAPAADDDVETVRDGLRKGAYGRPSEIRDAAEALKRIAARLAHLEGQQRLCEIDCANQEARANDAESRLAQFEALAERAHNALDGDNMIAGVRVLHDLAALRREGV